MKKYLFMIIGIFMCLSLSGCKTDDLEDITVYTTVYPIEYITNKLYGDHSEVYSIYPNEVIELSEKLIKDYSTAELFVYDGLSEEKSYAVSMLNNNKDLKIVDATMGMSIEYSDEELWLNPSNFLMLCLNIKNGMKEYITNTLLRNDIEEKYNELKVEVSELDAEIKLLVENADCKEILVSNDLFTFMTKYDLKVYSLGDTISEKTREEIRTEIANGNIKYIIMLPTDELTEEDETFITDNNVTKLYYNSLTTITSEDKSLGKDYLSIMEENLDILKQELYD